MVQQQQNLEIHWHIQISISTFTNLLVDIHIGHKLWSALQTFFPFFTKNDSDVTSEE